MKKVLFLFLVIIVCSSLVGYSYAVPPASPQELFEEGEKYYNADGVPCNFDKAAELFQKAADQGYAPAQYALGGLYNLGRGVPKDRNKAFEWSQKAAEQGYAEAQNALGTLYATGRGVSQDYGKAIEWYQKAADQGFAHAQFNLGIMYEKGNGVPEDDVKAYAYALVAKAGLPDHPNLLSFEAWLLKHLSPSQQVQAQEEAEKIRAALKK